MAEGYAHVTGRPGVAMVTSGPAATNIVTPLCDAYMDSIPMVVITGQVPVAAIGTDAFQECDTIGITRSVTKHNELVTSAADIPRAVREAFHIATTGRPGPVLLDIPKDIVDPKNPNSQMEWHWPSDDEVRDGLPGYKPTLAGHPRKIREAAEMILRSERPVIYAGGGILKARAAEALRELAELCDIHVVTTLMARGAFPDSHPLALGMPGMHGNYTAVTSMQRSDLLIALGQPLRRPGHRQGRRLRPRGEDHPRRHRPGRARQGAPARRADRRRLPARDRGARRRAQEQARRRRRRSPIARRGSRRSPAGRSCTRSPTCSPTRATRSSRSSCSSSCATTRPTTASSPPASVSTRCGRRSTGSSTTPTRG